MAERSSAKKVLFAASQTKKPPSSSSKTQRLKKDEVRFQNKSAPAATKNNNEDFFAKEELYILLNAELEAKTPDLVRQAEQVVKEQNEVLSKPLSILLLPDNKEDYRGINPQQNHNVQDTSVKVVTKKKATSKNMMKEQGKQPHGKTLSPWVSFADDLATVEDSGDCFLAKTIQSMEEKMNDPDTYENDEPHIGDNVGSDISNAQIRVLKAKVCIMQEELDQLSCDYYKKDDENAKLSARIKELEEDQARLKKTTNIQQAQIEKHRALAAESVKKHDHLQLQVAGFQKEIENLNRSHKQAAAAHSSVELRLNRALEEAEGLKTQLSKMKQTNKDKLNEEQQSKENLLAENKILKKQKAELIAGFKKQLKLIDILKKQKMHFEAAKLLSFTEEEFMKALDWGNA